VFVSNHNSSGSSEWAIESSRTGDLTKAMLSYGNNQSSTFPSYHVERLGNDASKNSSVAREFVGVVTFLLSRCPAMIVIEMHIHRLMGGT
jgi:hypothetical protein